MNTAVDFSRADTERERATLGDLMRAVETMRVRALGATDAEFQHLAMVVVGLAEDMEHMSGLVDGGEVYDAERLPDRHTQCFCQGRTHRNEDRQDLSPHRRSLLAGAHRIKAHIYAVITEAPA